jgi:peptidoglycan/xylan/chitin deacetylase (PgdA/CDA1 family)
MNTFPIHSRRQFLKQMTVGSAALMAGSTISACNEIKARNKLFLLRYDTEWWGEWSEMDGFIEKVIEIHKTNKIPATFFCKGETLFNFKEQFKEFYQEVKGDPLFDFQDHSYTHVGLGYEKGKTIDVLKADYEKSFVIHEEIFRKQPEGISMCGTSKDGPRLQGFDSTEKSLAEFEMIADQDIKMIDTFHSAFQSDREFMNYTALGHPEIMGFPSGYSDTAWMYGKDSGDAETYILSQIKEKSDRNEHMPLMLHDWVAWQHAPDKELSHVVKFTDHARELGYELVTHMECVKRKNLWHS